MSPDQKVRVATSSGKIKIATMYLDIFGGFIQQNDAQGFVQSIFLAPLYSLTISNLY
jgi:hypothetical protein